MTCLQKFIVSAPNANRLCYGIVHLTPWFYYCSMCLPVSGHFYGFAVSTFATSTDAEALSSLHLLNACAYLTVGFSGDH